MGSPHKDDEKKCQYGVESDFTILKFGINLFKVNESKATLASVCIDFCHQNNQQIPSKDRGNHCQLSVLGVGICSYVNYERSKE